jgi:polyisoprenoid-binding protein YceI
MKQSLILLIAFFSTMSLTAATPVDSRSIDVEASSITWVGKKVTGSHTGLINLKSGEIKMDENGNLSSAQFLIDMTSIRCTDLEGDSAAKLEGHLKSDDFFGIAQFETAKLDVKRFVPNGRTGEYKAIADLTIKGITKEIKFYVMTTKGGAKANITVDRTDFNVKYGSGSFFDNLGDKTIYDNFDLAVNLVY